MRLDLVPNAIKSSQAKLQESKNKIFIFQKWK